MNKNMNRKGQASMEFLMTYGWAILAAVLAIGVLGYYGVFSPGSSLPDTCLIGQPLTCGEYFVDGTGDTIRLIVHNGVGTGISISSMSVGTCDVNATVVSLGNGDDIDVLFPNCEAVTGDKYDGDISFTYLRSGKQIPETVTGNLRATGQ